MTTFGGLKQHAFKETFFFFFCIYLWLCWVFVAAWAFSSCSEQGLLSKSQCLGSSLWWPLMLLSRGSGIVGSVVSTGSLVMVHWLTCSEATKGSFQTRGQTCVSCIGRWILYPWAPREAPTLICFFLQFVSSEVCFPGLKSRCRRGCTPSGGCRGESISLPFLASRPAFFEFLGSALFLQLQSPWRLGILLYCPTASVSVWLSNLPLMRIPDYT